MRGRRLRWLALAMSSAVAACAGTAPGTWFTPEGPALRVKVAAGCPPTDAGVADVVNTFRGPPLAPAGPVAGIICQYGPRNGSGLPGSTLLLHSRTLNAAEAGQLVTVIRRMDLRRAHGVFHCPADIGLATVIGLSYPGRVDVGLWHKASGCQTLDNGRLGAFQG